MLIANAVFLLLLARSSAAALDAVAWLTLLAFVHVRSMWLVREQWFDACDAALWLTALATIENDVLRARAGWAEG